MVNVIESTDLESRPGGTVKFVGEAHGTTASFFHVFNNPGQGPVLHVHPYAETWIVRAGSVRFTVGEMGIEATAGQIVVAPPSMPHKFVNVGDGQLEMICIHPWPRIIQQDLTE